MGHGHTKLYIPWAGGQTYHLEAYALNVETTSGPAGDQTILSVGFRDHGPGWEGEEFTVSLDLRVLLGEAFGPNP
jgi:hypothetical protein